MSEACVNCAHGPHGDYCDVRIGCVDEGGTWSCGCSKFVARTGDDAAAAILRRDAEYWKGKVRR